MSDNRDATISMTFHPTKCPNCGHYSLPTATACEKCGGTLTLELAKQPLSTMHIERRPRGILTTTQGQIEFLADYHVVLQIFPSGACLQASLEKPIMLGRAISATPDPDLLNLEAFNANQHGVSRKHCLLSRQEDRLIVTDLNSTNGTYLGGRKLTPQEGLPAAHGDHLVLGTLHMAVFFSTIQGE